LLEKKKHNNKGLTDQMCRLDSEMVASETQSSILTISEIRTNIKFVLGH